MNIEAAKRFFSPGLTPKEAAALQQHWREQVLRRDGHRAVRTICGVDVAYDPVRNLSFAAAVLVALPKQEVLEAATARSPVRFPYVPGLLGFREAPAVLEALERLSQTPDLLLVDGHGVAHPRRCGLASMLGLALDIPVIGCAKSLLVGEYQEPGPRAGDWSPLRIGNEIIGAVLRTRAEVRPVFVSVGHRVSLRFALRTTIAATDGPRIPLPIRLADRAAARAKAGDSWK